MVCRGPKTKSEVAAVAVVVALIVGAGIGYSGIAGNAITRTENVTTTTTLTTQPVSYETTTFFSTIDYSGLQLLISLSGDTIRYNGSLVARATLYNFSNRTISLTPDFSANPALLAWGNYNSNCHWAGLAGMINFAVYSGHYAASNLSLADAPLRLVPSVAQGCPNEFYLQSYVRNVQFMPQSDLAVLSANASFSNVFKPQTIGMQLPIYTAGCTTSPYNFSETISQSGTVTTSTGATLAWGCGGGTALSGYWTMPANGTYITIDSHNSSTITKSLNALYQNYYHPLLAGSYTIVAEDPWNQAAFAYFQVS